MFRKNNRIDKLNLQSFSDNLIIAGDIGNVYSSQYEQFLTRVSKMFNHVFIISGNHEYYYHRGKYISDTDQWMLSIEEKFGMLQKV